MRPNRVCAVAGACLAALQGRSDEGGTGCRAERVVCRHGRRIAHGVRCRHAASFPRKLAGLARCHCALPADRCYMSCVSRCKRRSRRLQMPGPALRAGLLGEYLPPRWHEKLLQAVCSGEQATGERLQPLAEISNCDDPSRPEKRAKVRAALGHVGTCVATTMWIIQLSAIPTQSRLVFRAAGSLIELKAFVTAERVSCGAIHSNADNGAGVNSSMIQRRLQSGGCQRQRRKPRPQRSERRPGA